METLTQKWPPEIDTQKITEKFASQRLYFESGSTHSFNFRRRQLKQLQKMVKQNAEAIEKALHLDFGKPVFEAFSTEVGFLLEEIDFALDHLYEWTQTKSVPTPAMYWPAESTIHYQPKGVVLIISPWNYPFQLAISPLIAALAAGNTAFIKPSEQTPYTACLIEKLIAEYFDPQYITVVQGDGAALVPNLIKNHQFNHVFFTGSVPVGREVAKLAARHLIPVTLELGGKSPVIVDETANLKVAAERIALGKWMNAGQTCVAPDYLLLHSAVKDEFIDILKDSIKTFFGDDVLHNKQYTQMVHEKHFNKQLEYLKHGKIYFGGESSLATRRIAPTLIEAPGMENPLMQDEIFGPVLPFLTFDTNEDVRELIAHNPDPLALYIFSKSKKQQTYFIEHIRFGGGMINGTVMHLGNPSLPFGGVGTSGLGNYHGHQGFLTFSHQKSIMKQVNWINPKFIYPPHKKWALKLMKWLMG